MICCIEPSPRAGQATWCPVCKQAIAAGDVRECVGSPEANNNLDTEELLFIFGEADATLLGNRIAKLTTVLGIPPCGDCNGRRDWVNRAHDWVRQNLRSLTQ